MQLGKSGIKQNILSNLRKNILGIVIILIVLIFVIQLWFFGLISDYFGIFIEWRSDLFYKIKNKIKRKN